MAYSIIKFMWNFIVYYGKNKDTKKVVNVAWKDAYLAYKVVLDLATDVQGKGHVIGMDNFFTFVGLFEKLIARQIYATNIVKSNRIGLPLTLKNTSTFKNVPQSTLE